LDVTEVCVTGEGSRFEDSGPIPTLGLGRDPRRAESGVRRDNKPSERGFNGKGFENFEKEAGKKT
jgi:hypothetical protein